VGGGEGERRSRDASPLEKWWIYEKSRRSTSNGPAGVRYFLQLDYHPAASAFD